MNEQEYRRIVQQIRWSDSKRSAIEAALSGPQPAESADTEWHDAEQHRIEITHSSAKRTEAIIMKQAKSRRLLLAGIAAAILATGGAIAAIAGQGFKRSKTTDITHPDTGAVLHLTDEENAPYYLYPNALKIDVVYIGDDLNNYEDPAGMVTPTENGCYYYQETAGQGKESYVLMYRDFASGKSVPVCAKPNCKHDGSEYCTASSHVYAPSHLEYHDGYLYALTTKFLHPEKRGMNSLDFNVFVCTDPETGEAQMVESTEDCHQVLLRYSPDGTQIEELYDFGTGKGISRCLFHRGYIWCLVQLQTSGESTENTITNDSSSFINGGWQLWGYELASGKTVLLCDGRPKPGVNHVNPTPSDFSASGDYLYFCRCSTDWSGSQNALSRISLLTGREETVLRNDEYGYSFCMTKVLCKDKPKQIKSRTIPYYSVMDLITREKSESRPIFDQNYDFDGKKYQILLTSIFMDEEYIIADGWELSDPNSNVPLGLDENASDKTFVLDHDLNLISITDKFVNKIDMATLSSTESTAEFHFDGTEALCEYQGWLYVVDLSVGIKAGIGQVKEPLNGRNSYTVKRFPISDLLSGEEPHYETVYTYEY